MRQSALPMNGLPASVLLESQHYLGRSHRASFTYEDGSGVMVFAAPTARHIPTRWLELVRWCLLEDAFGTYGSQQWKSARCWLLERSEATTVVSYSDPSVGHTGALYRACNWLWAPTWHRLKPAPTGHGSWTPGKTQGVKDRWVAVLRPDAGRAAVLMVRDDKARREMPWAEYREPRWKRGTPQLHTGGGDYKRWLKHVADSAEILSVGG